MKTTLFISITALALAILHSVGAERANTPSEMQELRQKVVALEEQVRELQKKIESFEKRPAFTSVGPTPPGVNPPANGIPRRFNGDLYYIVPLQNQEAKPEEPRAKPR